MWIDTDFEEYLTQNALANSCIVTITDLDNIIFTKDKSYIQKPISKKLVKLLLDFSLNAPSRQVVDNTTSILPITDVDTTQMPDCRQIIMPLYCRERLSGLIITLFYKEKSDNALEVSKIMRVFSEEKLQSYSTKDIVTFRDIDLMFSEESVLQVGDLLDSKLNFLQKVEGYKVKKEQLSKYVGSLEKTLNKDQQHNFDNVLEKLYETEDYEKTLAYNLGLKYGNELSKI